jgi:dihydroorotate dehydrogenase
LPAEQAHGLVVVALRALSLLRPLEWLVRALLRPRDPAVQVEALGTMFASPIGLAAGFDKDATVFDAISALGFGFVEVGTLTGRPQAGNPRPRLFRLPQDRALINRMGFNNEGAVAAAPRLARRRHARLGVNIGKTKVVGEAETIGDYEHSARVVAPYADYLVVNVSSPNTPGLRDLQTVERLRPLILAVRASADVARPGRRVPLLVKIAPDLSDDDVDAVAELALTLGLDGIIATNTTVSRAGLRSSPADVAACGEGGLSGPPLRPRSVEVLTRLRRRVGPGMALISVGGIENVDDVIERFRAGATLVQVYTGLVYEGPLFAWRVSRQLAKRLRALGLPHVSALASASTEDARRSAAARDPNALALGSPG